MNLEALVLPLEVGDKAFKAGIGAAVAGVGALVGAMGVAIKATFDWASELDSIGDVMDVTNEQAAALNFTLRKSGVDTATFTKGVVILSKGLVKADGSLDTTGKALEDWGISVKDANGTLKDQATLVEDVAAKYATFGTQQEKVNFLTEVFGKSGAELIDFFDVMASEGGMDAVTEKVKALGLAIDPARYENFQRNLEEIKLMGLGLGVALTEQVMPALEGIVGWASRFIEAPLEDKFAMLADPAKVLFNMTDWFKNAADSIDWATVSQDLAARVQNIDWALTGQYVREGVSNVLQGIGTIIEEIDWEALAKAGGESFKELVAGLSGYPDWESFATEFNNGVNNAFDQARNYSMADFKEDWANFIEGLKSAFQSFLDWANAQAAATPGRNVTGGDTTDSSNSGGSGRASGGPVIAGQQYQVSEFFHPERFTPAVNGRVDPIQQQSATAGMGDDVFIQRFADTIARSLRSELQKAGRK